MVNVNFLLAVSVVGQASELPVASAVDQASAPTVTLYEVLKTKDIEQLRQALEAGADVDEIGPRTLYPYSALHQAVDNDDQAAIELLIDKGASLDLALACALLNLDRDAAQFLLEKGANPNARVTPPLDRSEDDEQDLSQPMIILAARGPVPNIELLLQYGADINATDPWGKTAVLISTRMGWSEKVRFLAEQGADLEKADEEGHTPLGRAYSNRNGVRDILLEFGADPNDHAALDMATRSEELDYLKQLVAAGLDMEYRYEDGGDSLLLMATKRGSLEGVEYLLQQGAAPDQQSDSGLTPLIQAAKNEADGDILKILLKAGANVDLKAKKYGDTALIFAAVNGNVDGVEQLLAYKPDLNAQGNYEATALNFAAAKGHTDVVRLLLEAKADPNLASNTGRVPLHMAIRSKDKEAVRLLLEAGADPKLADRKGATAWDFAADNEEILQLVGPQPAGVGN